jgi:hypothetical protein
MADEMDCISVKLTCIKSTAKMMATIVNATVESSTMPTVISSFEYGVFCCQMPALLMRAKIGNV